MGSVRSVDSSNSAIFLPRLKTHRPCSVSAVPHAAKTRSFHARVAVMSSGVWGRVRKTRLRPRFRSKVCRQRPTEVVIWKEVLPRGIEVNGMEVEDTRPIVCSLLVL